MEEKPTRDILRSRRKRSVRARTINVQRSTLEERARLRRLNPDVVYERPGTRQECRGAQRPCPYVACAHNLYLDVGESGNIKINFPDLELHELTETCSLDVAERGSSTLEQVADLMNITRERVRQVEVIALSKLERDKTTQELVREWRRS